MSSNGKAKGKGKEIAEKGSSGKRKRGDPKAGGRKRTNRAVLQFFEDAADEASDYDTSDFEDDFADDDDEEPKEQVQPGKHHQLPVFPKEEELSGDELERVLEERYKSGSGYVTYAEDDYETKRVDKNFAVPSAQDPVIWKVKCKVGRERQSIFCLMQKYVDLKSLGTKLQIIAAFSVEHMRGFIFVEANKQFEVMEACKQLPDVYYSMITHVPSSEFSQLLAARKKQAEVSKGMWVRLKNGNYKGDLAQVVAVNDSRKKATVKLIPRVDFQALTAKFGGGSSTKRSAIPKPRLISSSDLEEFRPLIQFRRDRDTGMQFEVLDSLMLKDGYLYKKVSIDSLRFCDVNPSVEELQKFRTSNNEDSGNMEFLSQLYGDKKEKSTLKPVQGVGGKGEGTSGSKEQEDMEVHDLVLFGKREFGMVLGMEKDENYKILKYGSEGSTVVSLAKKDLKNLNLEKKFNALDHRMKTIYVNDVVKILDGPLKDKEGVVKQIYRGIIFLYDQNDLEDNAYFCARSQLCEKVKHNDNICLGKNDGAGPSGCEDLPSSPKTPLSPEKPWQTEDHRNFNRREQEGGFSVGQSLRIRVGPLKGYLCRVLAVRRSDVTVKLDSRQKVLTVKSEHLSEVRGKSFATSTCDDTGLDSSRPFDFLGNNSGGNDWMAGSVNADRNEEGQSNEGSAWPAFTSSTSSLPWGAGAADTSGPTVNAAEDSWQKKPSTTLGGGSNWGQDVAKSDNSSVPQNDACSSWDKGKNVTGSTSSWGNVSAEKDQQDSWNSSQNANLSGSWNEKGSDVSAKQWASEPSGSAGWGPQKSVDSTIQASQNAWDQSKNSQDESISNAVKDSWGKAVDTWGSKCSSSGTNDRNNSVSSTDPRNGGWGAAGASWTQPEGEKATGGWKKRNNEDATADYKSCWGKVTEESQGKEASSWGGWGNSSGGGVKGKGDCGEEKIGHGWVKGGGNTGDGGWNSSGWKNSSGGGSSWGGTGSYGGSKGDEDGGRDHGDFGGRRGRGRGGYREGRDQEGGRGRGRSYGGGRQSWNRQSQDKPSWGSSGGNESQSGSWGGSSSGGGGACGWGAGSSSGAKPNEGDGGSWAGRSSCGWGAGSSGGAMTNEGGDASWSKSDLKQEDSSTQHEGWTGGRGSGERSSEPGGGWNDNASGWGQQKSSEKDSSTWGKATEESQRKDASSWGGWGNSSGGVKGGSTNCREEKSGNDWGKGGGDTGGGVWKSSGWGKSSGGGSGWGTGSYGGSKDDEDGGRGLGDFGGRRGRGGYRGRGRDLGGRGRGRSYGGERQSWNSQGQDKPSWGSNRDGNEGGGAGGWGSGATGAGSTWAGGSSGSAKDNEGGRSSSWGSGKTGGGSSSSSWGGSSGGAKGIEGNGAGGWGSGSTAAGNGWGGSSGTANVSEGGASGGWGSGSAGGVSSWGGSSNSAKGNEGSGSGSWGGSGGTKGNEGGGSGGWRSGSTGAGGSSWGGSSGGSKGNEGGGTGGWGSGTTGGGSSWGGSSGSTKGNEGGGSRGWGSGSSGAGGSSLGGSKGNEGGGTGSWGSGTTVAVSSGGGSSWGGSKGKEVGGSDAGSGGWGNSSGGNSGWGKDTAGGDSSSGGGWGK